MKIFVTGATGWVGTSVVAELLRAGHEVTGLARSTEKATALAATGAKVVIASLDDLEVLRSTASLADAVIHTAFNHDFSKFAANAEQDRRAVEAMGDALVGSKRPLLVTSGLNGLALGRLATELDQPSPSSVRKSEAAAKSLADRGVRVATVRLAPSVHGQGDHGFIPIVIRTAREKGVSAFVDDGQNCWSGVHRLDAARVYRLALEQGATESVYHAVADESVPFQRIAEVIGRRLGLPVESRGRDHFGWFGNFAASTMAASSAKTRAVLGWKPEGPDLLTDLDQASYYES